MSANLVERIVIKASESAKNRGGHKPIINGLKTISLVHPKTINRHKPGATKLKSLIKTANDEWESLVNLMGLTGKGSILQVYQLPPECLSPYVPRVPLHLRNYHDVQNGSY
jgi:hypothetical protein